ncbi:ANTAR domain-containing protein [Gordonia sp. X0973]|uniref:PAS and ANTAR domain-containing protein n=1 Tax=Gordonia sp. X0973 TaxID=2742602 RepID=UPI000F5296C3|nr:PAS and ANTAR domain-containing protein [Gordonia sp. X0973]QKT08330.1 ANTAR domain-containing protein [Gordonia sp. X0973]
MTQTHPAEEPARPFPVGQFWYHFDEDRWVWSDELARIHGYSSAADVEPTTALMLAHKHPDDKDRVEQLITRVRTARESFSGQHRVIDAQGRVVPVVVVADTFTDRTGTAVGTTGYYVALPTTGTDTEPPVDLGAEQAVRDRVEKVVDRRAVIEQAKGALRLVYRLDDQQAFDLLTWRSQETNTKVRDLAAAICDQLGTLDLPSAARARFDHLLLTAHEAAASVDADED